MYKLSNFVHKDFADFSDITLYVTSLDKHERIAAQACKSYSSHSSSSISFGLKSFKALCKPCWINASFTCTCQRPKSVLPLNLSTSTLINKVHRLNTLNDLVYFVRDDGSILLDDTSNFIGEQKAAQNLNSVRGFNVIDDIKEAVEKVCHGVVSCADILTMAARESVVILGGLKWRVSPPPSSSLANLISSYKAQGLSKKDMVALSGAHTIGVARYTNFRSHIYNETNIDSSFASQRQSNCPRTSGSGDNNLAPLDVQTQNSFDNNYYKNLFNKKGLFHSDQQLFNGGSTDSQVRRYSNNPKLFNDDFVKAMIKMGNIKPLTVSKGEIRRKCGRVN
ncbi:hypothetical protein MKW94_005851 [Papaver nudicaule]|uniref:Peroxidase n=1 Tax=Papaver nudicaule TaxID=74823 RepID=A0AA41SEY2_PAPNU|nr:hypothetical protein [Papaver nudicaule]